MTLVTAPKASSPTAAELHEQRSAPLPHLPALDGVRGFALIGMLLFHGGFAWAKGGFLSVSTFFTLSGFLITNLLVREWEKNNNIALLKFWGRRLRRLMPAALAAIALIGIVWWRIGTPEQLSSLRGDMLSSLGYMANWHLWSTGVSYGNLFSQPTPLQHFWSLAVEEQFYLVFPIVVVVLMRVGGRRLLAGVCVIAAFASLALMWLQRADFDRIYYGTDTRVAELLFGVLLAIWWSGRARNTASRTRMEPFFDGAAVLALGAIIIAWHSVHEASPQLAKGGFPLYAVMSTILVYVCTRAGWMSRVMSNGFLRWAGLTSYGLYLYHWPVFTLLSPDRTGISLAPLFVIRMVVTIALALASYYLLEMPVRRGTLFKTTKTAGRAALLGIFSVALCAFAVTLDPPKSTIPYANMKISDIGIHTETLNPTNSAKSGQTAAKVWIIGDSGAMDESPALAAAIEATGATQFTFGAGPGFGLTTGIDWRADWSKTIAKSHPDLAVVMLGSWDLPFIRENGEAAYEKVVDEAVTLLTDQQIRVMLLPVMPGGKLDVSIIDRVFASVAAKHLGMTDNPSILSAFLAPDGTTPRYWVESDGTVHLLRKKDNWHLCQEGAGNLAVLVVNRAYELGWSAPIRATWTDGAWREAWQFDNPVGVCDGI
jgi:peptidoglycan/LPS O-acetylase OafA/YrhL